MLLIAIKTNAQTLSIDTILYNGSADKYINLVYLGDGYQESELATYKTNVENSANYLFSISPFKEYKKYFNVFAIVVPSQESGADHPRTASDCPPESSHPLLVTNTYFDATFDYYQIHRLLVPVNSGAINSVMMNNLPLFNQGMILVNSIFYGGSGGTYATASTNSSSNEVMVHELGHSFGGLSDEYWAGDFYAAENVNMTQETNPSLVRWKNWIGFNNVGVYQHCCGGTSASWYRPHENCKMRYLGVDFCPVCKEAITLKVMEKFGTPINSYLPNQSNITFSGNSVQFSIDLTKPSPNTLSVKWFLNGSIINQNNEQITIQQNQLLTGNNALKVEILDTTALIRDDNHANLNTYTVEWAINNTSSGINIAQNNRIQAKIYPNPVKNEMIIEIKDNKEIKTFEIMNANGQQVYIGLIKDKTSVQTADFKLGIYLLKFNNNDSFEYIKFVKE